MALIKINTNSSVFNMGIPLYVILPQQGAPKKRGGTELEGPYRTLYLLHGFGGDYTEWVRNTAVERFSAEHSIAVVMPSGDNSFYSDMENGMKYQRFLTEELISMCEAWFPLSSDPKDRFIGGFSMGGYGALRTAISAPQLYSKVVAISSRVDIRAKYDQKDFEDRAKLLFGEKDELNESGADLFAAAERMALKDKLPEFYLAVGNDDSLFNDSVRMKEVLTKHGVKCTFLSEEGRHDYEFAGSALGKALPWMLSESWRV